MVDYKISDTAGFPNASTLGGTEKLAGVQSGANVNITTLQIAAYAGTAYAGGRLTLTTALPVTTADVTGATTIYYALYNGNTIPLYDGTQFAPTTFTELSNLTAQSSTGKAGPAAVTTNSNYDLFVWSDSGTVRLTRGPLWTSDTGRGTGAGTTELTRVNGIYLNANAITNGPTASRGTYVGTVRSDGSSQINDSAAKRHVWNNFNRVQRHMAVTDTTDTWTYSTTTWRQARAASTNQLDYVCGLAEDAVFAEVLAIASTAGSASSRSVLSAVGVDSTTTPSGVRGAAYCDTTYNLFANPRGVYTGTPGLGRHTLVWLEMGGGADTQTWAGDNGGANLQSGIFGVCTA